MGAQNIQGSIICILLLEPLQTHSLLTRPGHHSYFIVRTQRREGTSLLVITSSGDGRARIRPDLYFQTLHLSGLCSRETTVPGGGGMQRQPIFMGEAEMSLGSASALY